MVAMFIRNFEARPCDYAEVIPYFVLSPEDPHYTALRKITSDYMYTDIENHPLGRKKNEGLSRAMSLEWDYLMELGSDTVYTDLLWELLADYLMCGEPAFGFRNIYIYEPKLHKAVFEDGYHIGRRDTITALGPGRCLRRDVVDRCFPLWVDAAPFGMDGDSDHKLFNCGFPVTVIDNQRLPVLCDVKGSVCLTSWMQWEECGEPVDAEWVREVFNIPPYECHNITNFDAFHTAVLKKSVETRNKGEAFDYMNEIHRHQMGFVRYASYESYKNAVSRKYKRG